MRHTGSHSWARSGSRVRGGRSRVWASEAVCGRPGGSGPEAVCRRGRVVAHLPGFPRISHRAREPRKVRENGRGMRGNHAGCAEARRCAGRVDRRYGARVTHVAHGSRSRAHRVSGWHTVSRRGTPVRTRGPRPRAVCWGRQLCARPQAVCWAASCGRGRWGIPSSSQLLRCSDVARFTIGNVNLLL